LTDAAATDMPMLFSYIGTRPFFSEKGFYIYPEKVLVRH